MIEQMKIENEKSVSTPGVKKENEDEAAKEEDARLRSPG